MPPRYPGFSLIELMITVAVIGILAAIAYPSYQQYVIRGHRASGQQFMMDLAQRQEQFLIDSRQYGQTLAATDLNMTLPAGVAQDYSLTITVNAAGARPFFQAALVPKAGLMANDGRLFINSRGERWRETDTSCAVDASLPSACSASTATALGWQ